MVKTEHTAFVISRALGIVRLVLYRYQDNQLLWHRRHIGETDSEPYYKARCACPETAVRHLVDRFEDCDTLVSVYEGRKRIHP
jgi:hypothetical protein